jgi:hypothetical protein
MNGFLRFLLAAGFALAALEAVAAPAAIVEGVQMPAWVEREGTRTPAAPGMELRGGDQLRTGAGSRMLVKLADGSLVKLGENGSLTLAALAPAPRAGVFRAALNVLEGAFRFTTEVAAKQRRRDVTIRIATVTAGIRGTDLWGRSREDRQIVCLIEGKIEVGAEGEAAQTMDQPLQFYQRDKGKTAPIGFVDPKQLEQWAKETEIEAGKGAARRGGKWKVELLRAATQEAALRVYDQVRLAGYAAEIRPEKEADKYAYIVRISNLPSNAEADALAARLKGRYGVADPKVRI